MGVPQPVAEAVRRALRLAGGFLAAWMVVGLAAPALGLELSALDGSNGFVVNGVAASDQSGFSVSAAGDVNGDGIDDLLIGAPNADPNGTQSGASYVVFGSSAGFSSPLELSALDGSNGFVVNGVAVVDDSGRSVSAAGDVNGDGVDDLLIGAPGADPNGFLSGASYVVFGEQEPAVALAVLIADVDALALPQGIRDALVALLESAINQLEQGNVEAAIGPLGAFMNLVEAQRGKQIDEADADALIAGAEAIIAAL